MLFGPCSRYWTPALFSAVRRLKEDVSPPPLLGPAAGTHQGSLQPNRLILCLWQVPLTVPLRSTGDTDLADGNTQSSPALLSLAGCHLAFNFQKSPVPSWFMLYFCRRLPLCVHRAPPGRAQCLAGSALQDRAPAPPRAAQAWPGSATRRVTGRQHTVPFLAWAEGSLLI